ncbi:MAG: flagellar hook-associated protein FlgL [Pirellulaceae bacterium]
MAGIYPIPTGRSSDALLSRRLMFQLQTEQKRLLEVQQQIVTGRRFQLPSGDASSANRAISLQRILEGKQQQQTNLSITQSYLHATDTALGGVADLLGNVRGLAIQAADTTTSDVERKALALEIQATMSQLQDVGNQQFRGRYLFAGSESTVPPFVNSGKYVAYLGNNTSFRTYANRGLLLDTNVPGQELFGAISAEVRGADLDPVLTPNTRLSDLRGGQGISKGGLQISDGTNTSTISLANAETLGDVQRLIEANPPLGRTVTVTIDPVDPRRLRVEIDAAGGGVFTIRDEPGGKTAAEFGIARGAGYGVDPIVGSDLNPILRATTPLDNLLGGGWDRTSGLQITNGGETHVIDIQTAATLEDLLNILNGAGAHVLAEINEQNNGINVRSRLSGGDFSIGENGGSTATDLGLRSFAGSTPLTALNYRKGVDKDPPAKADISFAPPGNVDTALRIVAKTGGTQWKGIDIELRASGTPFENRALATFNGSSLIIDVEDGVTTANDVIAAVMAEGTFRAELNSSTDLTNDGSGTLVAADALPATTAGGTAFTIRRSDGVELAIDISSARTLSDVLEAINGHPDNLDPATAVTAQLRAFGNGIELVDANPLGTFTLQVRRSHSCSAAWDLGLVPRGADVSPPPDPLVAGGPQTVAGRDVNLIETQGVFNSLTRLYDAVENYDVTEIQRIIDMLDEDFDRLTFGRAEVGARGQSVSAIATQNEDEQVELRTALSDEIDVDFAQAASDFAARQATYEASLRSIANLFKLSLLDFL